MNKLLTITVCVLLTLLSMAVAKPAFAVVPEVRNVIPYPVGGSTYLNVTVYHTPEIPSHYVNVIMVTVDTNSTSLTIDVQPLNPDDTFYVQYDMGPISGTPTIHVEVHCIVNGWSAEWIGSIPEYPTPALLTMMFVLSAAILVFHRIKRRIRK
jgi:hypothetical protein